MQFEKLLRNIKKAMLYCIFQSLCFTSISVIYRLKNKFLLYLSPLKKHLFPTHNAKRDDILKYLKEIRKIWYPPANIISLTSRIIEYQSIGKAVGNSVLISIYADRYASDAYIFDSFGYRKISKAFLNRRIQNFMERNPNSLSTIVLERKGIKSLSVSTLLSKILFLLTLGNSLCESNYILRWHDIICL